MPEFKAVLLDFNGTLISDQKAQAEAWGYVDQKYGADLTRTIPKSGMSNAHRLRFLYPEFSDEKIDEISKEKEACYRQLLKEGNYSLRQGVYDLFRLLKEKDIPFLIASASIKENIDFFVENFQLDQFMDPEQIVYDDNSWPDKGAMFLEAARRLNVKPEETLILEDSPASVDSSLNRGFPNLIWMGDPNQEVDQKVLFKAQAYDEEFFKQIETLLSEKQAA